MLSTSIQSHPDLSSIHPIQAHPILDQSTPVRSRLVLSGLSISVRFNPVLSRLSIPVQTIHSCPVQSSPVQIHPSLFQAYPVLFEPIQSCPNQSSPVQEALRLLSRSIQPCPVLSNPIQNHPVLFRSVKQDLPIQVCSILSKPIQSCSHPSIDIQSHSVQTPKHIHPVDCSDLYNPLPRLVQPGPGPSNTVHKPIQSCPYPSSPVRIQQSCSDPSSPTLAYPIM